MSDHGYLVIFGSYEKDGREDHHLEGYGHYKNMR